MTDDKTTRQLTRKANRHARDGLSINDAVMLAFCDHNLDLPLTGKDTQGRPEWIGFSSSGQIVHLYHQTIQEQQ